jgi:hypothetical protein
MLTLYHGSGSGHYWVEGNALGEEEWAKRRGVAIRLLSKRGKPIAASLLETSDFEIRVGGNDFADEFSVVYRAVGLDDYVEFESYSRSPEHRSAFKHIAETLIELGIFVRFIGVELVVNPSPQPVSAPKPKVTSATVEKALVDAEQMITQQNPASAVDRVHTALHGYLREVCSDAAIGQTTGRLGLTDLVKLLREQHPAFSQKGDRGEQLTRILKAFSAICDVLNQIRNDASLAHPNEQLLDYGDAMLAVNAARTILHYVHGKLQS